MADINTSVVTEEYVAALADSLRHAMSHGRIIPSGFFELVDRVASGEAVSPHHVSQAFGKDVAEQLLLHTYAAFERGFYSGREVGGQGRADVHRAAAITGYSQRYSPEAAVDAAERVVQALRLRGLL